MRNFKITILFLAVSLSSCWHEGSAQLRYCIYKGRLSVKVKSYNFSNEKKLHMTTSIRKGGTDVVYEKVYYQRLPNGEYVKLGKSGFVLRKGDYYAPVDNPTGIPDGFVSMFFDKELNKQYQVYRNGKPQLYTGPVVEGYIP